MATNEHPVWTLYDRLRSARLSMTYYGCRLAHFERLNKIGEVIVALASLTSAAVPGTVLLIKKELPPEVVLPLTICAAVVAAIKPILRYPEKIKAFQALVDGYNTLYLDLVKIRVQVEQELHYDKQMQAELIRAIDREQTLTKHLPEAEVNKKIQERCQLQVLLEFPVDRFLVPPRGELEGG